MTAKPLLYSYETYQCRSGQQVHLAFSSLQAGNLGHHLGQDAQEVLDHRQGLEEELLGERTAQGFAYLNQVHGRVVHHFAQGLQPPAASCRTLGQAGLDQVPEADAALSKGQPLAVMVADCIPLLFLGQGPQLDTPLLGVAHAGRRGLLDGVIEAEVEALLAQGAQSLTVWIGPSICGSCYEVPEDLYQESVNQLPSLAARTSWGSPALDLPAGARAILESLPQVEEVRSQLAGCTYEDENLYSHRAHLNLGRPAGRIAGLIWLDPEDQRADKREQTHQGEEE